MRYEARKIRKKTNTPPSDAKIKNLALKSSCTRNRTSFLIPHNENWFGREAKADEYLPAKKCIGKSMFCLVLDRNKAAKDCIFVKKKSPEKIMGIYSQVGFNFEHYAVLALR